MNLAAVAEAIAWSALLLALTAAAALSVLAFLRPRAAFLWFATVPSASPSWPRRRSPRPRKLGFAPLFTILGVHRRGLRRQPGRRHGAGPRDGRHGRPGLHGGIIVTERPPPRGTAGRRRRPRREVLRGGLTIGVLERIARRARSSRGSPRASPSSWP